MRGARSEIRPATTNQVMIRSAKPKKLSFGTETIRVLGVDDLRAANGGFTYSLSLGDRCQKSADFTDGYTCQCPAA